MAKIGNNVCALHDSVECSLAKEEEQEGEEKAKKKLREEGEEEKGIGGGGGVRGDEGRKSPGSKKAPALGQDQTAHVAKQNHM